MGKNKAKSQKQNVFQVANKKITKPKSKTKPVMTSLKKINILNDEKVSMVNKVFTEVQKEGKLISKAPASDSPKEQMFADKALPLTTKTVLDAGGKIPKPVQVEPVNVDAAVNLLSQL